MFGKSRSLARSLRCRCNFLSGNDFVPCYDNLRILPGEKKLVQCYSQDACQSRLDKPKDTTPVNKFIKRSHTCGELNIVNVGEVVQLCGWIEFQRMGKFIVLRDAYGSIQLIISDKKTELIDKVEGLNYESVLYVTGTVIQRPAGQENPKMKTGRIEVEVETLEVLNESKVLPFSLRQHNLPKESLQMQYRYLALRFPEMQRNLRLRSQVINRMRQYLIDCCGFVDVETPTLFRTTPGGAQEFIVPTQVPGKFYSLVQSPQQFKQLLMVGGIDKYFQVARCYRDEGARHDRQPEFTQLDIEMSFTDREGIMELVENLIAYSWPEELGTIALPIPRMTFEEVYEMYGSEQPDLRIPYRIHNITEYSNLDASDDNETYAMSFPAAQNNLTTSAKAKMNEIKSQNFPEVNLIQRKIGGDEWKVKLAKLFSEQGAEHVQDKLNLKPGDVFFMTRGKRNDARSLLGKLRVEFANIMEKNGDKVRSQDYKFLWVLDFPLFYKNEAGILASSHHPFTQAHPDDFQYLESDPMKVRGLHYDLVLNGSEIAGGSIRIHNAELQQRVFDMLQIDASQMKHLIDALASGAPPHGGIAFGLDRLISLMCNAPSIRQVIAFPKTMEGRDLMSGAPVEVTDEEKRLYHLKTLDKNTKT